MSRSPVPPMIRTVSLLAGLGAAVLLAGCSQRTAGAGPLPATTPAAVASTTSGSAPAPASAPPAASSSAARPAAVPGPTVSTPPPANPSAELSQVNADLGQIDGGRSEVNSELSAAASAQAQNDEP